MIASANKIVALSGRGIAVTSENAKALVRYLSDVENYNDDYIHVQYSSSKLGWIRGDFLPYDTKIVFDGNIRFKQIFDSIGERGSRNVWFDHVKNCAGPGGWKGRTMHEKLVDVWNLMWAAYKTFAKTGNIPEFTDSVHEIVEKYNVDPLIQQFTENIAISWTPVINAIKKEQVANHG